MAHPTGPRLVIGLIVGVVAAQALMLFAFAWPASHSGPREVPVAVAGPQEVVGQVEQTLASVPSRDDGVPAFDVVQVEDEAAATEAITDRDVYGAVVVGPDGPRLLVASAASPAVAQMLRTAAAELSQTEGVAVEDVVPTASDDPTGAGLPAGVLPLVLTSAAGGLAISLLLARRSERLVGVAGLAVAAGLASAALLRYGLGVVDGPYWELAGVVALMVGAVAAAVAGLGAVFGRVGAGLALAVMILLGNPFSAAPTAPEFLPQPWGELGQLLPPGAGITAVRSVGFFDGAALAQPLLVLSIWLVTGLLLVLLGPTGRGTVDVSEAGNVPERGTSETRSSAGA
ncbi:MAG TPA: hypothetical protein VFR23_09885 [Jiangellaceae bacterium]|nr:hypothetical protein [Jiangellaceae bacterium]